MIYAEQAVFTSAQTDQMSGYQLVGRSPGLGAEDAKELALWCPSHDSLWPQQRPACSCNFHPLPSGAYCISRTLLAGQEYSSRSGQRVYTHCLVVAPDALARFGNNPFALLRAATLLRPLPIYERVPEHLEPLELTGRSAVVDQMLLARLAVTVGAAGMGVLVQSALDSACLAVTGLAAPEPVIAGLISCLPAECRLEFSLATGLKPSLQRPFHVLGLAGPVGALREYQHRYNLTTLDLSSRLGEPSSPLSGWGHLIERVLSCGRTAFLATQLSKRRFGLSIADLPALALQLLEDLDSSAMRGEPAEKPVQALEPTLEAKQPMRVQQAHASHSSQAPLPETTPRRPEGPSKHLDPESPEVLEKLEQLDDAVFEAVGGKTAALDTLRVLWPQVRGELGAEMLAESREQYLRYALSIWEEYVACSAIRNPGKAVQALDVLCVLFDRL